VQKKILRCCLACTRLALYCTFPVAWLLKLYRTKQYLPSLYQTPTDPSSPNFLLLLPRRTLPDFSNYYTSTCSVQYSAVITALQAYPVSHRVSSYHRPPPIVVRSSLLACSRTTTSNAPATRTGALTLHVALGLLILPNLLVHRLLYIV